jgi:hypothetical protein
LQSNLDGNALGRLRDEAEYYDLEDLQARAEEALDKDSKTKYQHMLLGPYSPCTTEEAETKRLEDADRTERDLNILCAQGWRVAHMAADGDGDFVDVLLEKKGKLWRDGEYRTALLRAGGGD